MILRRATALVLLLILLASPVALLAQQQTQAPAPDPNDPVQRIKDEGMKNSQVMQTLSYLSGVIGPRLTASPGMKRANDWTRDQLTKWGLQNAHLESWGPFGRSWVLKSFSAEVIEPQTIPLIAYPKAWSPGAEIPTGEVVFLEAKNEEELARFKGQLRGKIVLAEPIDELEAHFKPQGTRLTEKQLLELADGGQGDDEEASAIAASPRFAE